MYMMENVKPCLDQDKHFHIDGLVVRIYLIHVLNFNLLQYDLNASKTQRSKLSYQTLKEDPGEKILYF